MGGADMKSKMTLSLFALAAMTASSPAMADDEFIMNEMRPLVRQLAFDPDRFFPDAYIKPILTIRYTGDDYDYPVYSLAVRRGCTDEDVGEARKTCGSRLLARMVRSPMPPTEDGETPRRRWAGSALFAALEKRAPRSEGEVKQGLDSYGLEWMEADVNGCAPALDRLRSAETVSFFAEPPVANSNELSLVLHADKVAVEFGGYITRSRYFGWLKPGSPAEWADGFAQSLETCWQPSKAVVPWRVDKAAEPEADDK